MFLGMRVKYVQVETLMVTLNVLALQVSKNKKKLSN